MKRFFLSFLLLMLFANSKADGAYTQEVYKVDNIYYRITSETERTCSASYLSYWWTRDFGFLPLQNYPQYESLTIPSQVSIFGDEFTVTGIDDYTFYGSKKLVSISIPNTVKTIGDYAFLECRVLKTISLPNDLEFLGEGCFSYTRIESFAFPHKINKVNNFLFSDCYSLNQVTFHEKMDSIGTYSFKNCGLKDISIPEGISYIGKNAFYGCTSLEDISFPESLTYIDDEAFSGCIKLTKLFIPKNVIHLGTKFVNNEYDAIINEINVDQENKIYSSIDGILYDKQKTRLILCPRMYEGDLFLPETVNSLDNFSFVNCRSIKSITFPYSLKSIGKQCFSGAQIISSISLPSNVESIGDSCFMNSYIPSISIPASTTFIGNDALAGNGFTEIIVDESNPNYSSRDGVFYNKDFSELIIYPRGKAAKSFVVPGQVKTICDYAFYNLSYQTYPSPLETIEIENGVEIIGRHNFQHFPNLKTVSLPASMKLIKYGSFHYCDNIYDVTVYATTPPEIEDVGLAASNRKLHVLPECLDIYKSSRYWSKFGRIVGDAVAGIEEITIDPDNQDSQFFTIDGKPAESMKSNRIMIRKSSFGQSEKIIVR